MGRDGHGCVFLIFKMSGGAAANFYTQGDFKIEMWHEHGTMKAWIAQNLPSATNLYRFRPRHWRKLDSDSKNTS